MHDRLVRTLAAFLMFAAVGALLPNGASAQAHKPVIANERIPADSALQIIELQDRLREDPYDAELHTKLGILFVNEDLLDEARTEFIAAIQAAPTDPASHLNLAVCLIKMEQYREAVQPLTAFNTMSPEDGRGYVLLGDAYNNDDDLAMARATWARGLNVVAVSPGDKIELARLIAKSHFDRDEFQETADFLATRQHMFSSEEGRPLAEMYQYCFLTMARTAQDEGRLEDALDNYRKAQQSGSTDPAAYTTPVELLIEQKRLDDADALLADATSAPGATADYLRGRVAESRGDLQAAARYYKSAESTDANFPGLMSALGGVLGQLGDSRGAQSALSRAADRGEGGTVALYNLAVTMTKRNEFADAIPLLRKVIEAEPERKDAHRALGLSYRKTEQFSKAAECYQTIIDQFGPDGRDLYQLAYAQAKVKSHEDAAANYQMVAMMEPENFNAHYGLGKSLLELGRANEAIEAFTRAVELDERNEIAVFNLAFAFQRAERFGEAIDTYLEANDLRETYRSYVNIAICYQNLGDTEASDEYYRKANDLKKKG